MIVYYEFLDFVEKVSIGTKKEDVESILGIPMICSQSTWVYDLVSSKGFPGIPPPSGVTVFTKIEIHFENNVVSRISRGWIDITSPNL
ncbi:MAG: hypothetical protein COA79_17420 [Planctomycetota bacterium]|nr:MAG: hypothetical protein COA79_17420 [Planctomycetota bacterium]